MTRVADQVVEKEASDIRAVVGAKALEVSASRESMMQVYHSLEGAGAQLHHSRFHENG